MCVCVCVVCARMEIAFAKSLQHYLWRSDGDFQSGIKQVKQCFMQLTVRMSHNLEAEEQIEV